MNWLLLRGTGLGEPRWPLYFRLGVMAITHSRPKKPARGGWVTGPAAEGLGEGVWWQKGPTAGQGEEEAMGTSTPDPPSEFLEPLPEEEAKAQEGSRTHPRSLVSGEAGGRRSFLHTAWPRGAALGGETVPTRMRTLQSLLLGQGIQGGSSWQPQSLGAPPPLQIRPASASPTHHVQLDPLCCSLDSCADTHSANPPIRGT